MKDLNVFGTGGYDRILQCKQQTKAEYPDGRNLLGGYGYNKCNGKANSHCNNSVAQKMTVMLMGRILVASGIRLIAWGFGHAFDLGVADLHELWRLDLKTPFSTSHQFPLYLPMILESDFDQRAWNKAIDLQFHLGGALGVMLGRGRESRSSGNAGGNENDKNPC